MEKFGRWMEFLEHMQGLQVGFVGIQCELENTQSGRPCRPPPPSWPRAYIRAPPLALGLASTLVVLIVPIQTTAVVSVAKH